MTLKINFIFLTISLILIGCGTDNESTTTIDSEQLKGFTMTDNTFTVNDSNITWQDGSTVINNKQYYRDIQNYCSNLTLDGITNWRVPSLKEYKEIYPYTDDLQFSRSDDNYIFWTSTENSANVTMFNFFNGLTPFYIRERINYYPWGLRCVHDN